MLVEHVVLHFARRVGLALLLLLKPRLLVFVVHIVCYEFELLLDQERLEGGLLLEAVSVAAFPREEQAFNVTFIVCIFEIATHFTKGGVIFLVCSSIIVVLETLETQEYTLLVLIEVAAGLIYR